MPLVQLWNSQPEIVLQYNIKQIVSAAGNGILVDQSECSTELRHYTANIPIEKLFEHAHYCLQNGFDKSGYALQDIVNEIGSRLDYEVEPGLYQGRTTAIGFDGIWRAPDGHALIVEVKTTDAYRINLDILKSYQERLIDEKRVGAKSSILIVVGRDDTGDLEAQIRGSRLAWDARIISVEALIKLATLKVRSEEEDTVEKIRGVLVPFEYTRLDNIIDVMFTAAQDVSAADDEDDIGNENHAIDIRRNYDQDHTPKNLLDQTRQQALAALEKRVATPLIAHKRTHYWSSDKRIRAVCIASKQYNTGLYWYGFHPHQLQFLEDSEQGFLLLGCVGSTYSYAVPHQILIQMLQHLNVTQRENGMYWHIHLQPNSNIGYSIPLPKAGAKRDVSEFELQLTPLPLIAGISN